MAAVFCNLLTLCAPLDDDPTSFVDLVTYRCELYFREQDGSNCLFLASQNDHVKVVNFILDRESSDGELFPSVANVPRFSDGATPLWVCVLVSISGLLY